MKHFLSFVFFVSVLCTAIPANADQWTDPSWRVMVDSSDAIALVAYTSNGMYRAEAKVLTVYKGQLTPGSQIWISGFSNRYGPYDSVSKGETFVVFLNRFEFDKDDEYWQERVKEDASLIAYYSALKNKRAFMVWTPTAGDLRVKNEKVQYDLLQTSFYSKQQFHSLRNFEAFLRFAVAGKGSETFCNGLLAQVKQYPDSKQTAQHLMMLYLTRYSMYNEVYDRLRTHRDPEVRFALAQVAGNVKSERSRNLLVLLLDDKNSFVQGEAVRRLAGEPKEIVGPILIEKLSSAGKGVAGRTDIMNPLLNTLNGGQVEIIETLAKLQYTDAVPALLPLLASEDDYTFKLVLETVKKLGSKEYSPYLIQHLNKGTKDLLFTISMTIAKDSLTECLPALMNYISTYDRSKHPTADYLVSRCCGLGHFTSDSVKRFLVTDFLSLLRKEFKTSGVDTKRDWVEEYIQTFTELGIDTLKPYLYDAVYAYYGLNHRFKISPELFEIKKRAEDSLAALAKSVLPKDSILKVDALAFLATEEGRMHAVTDYVLQYKTKQGVRFENMNRRLVKGGIAQTHLIANTGSFYHKYTDRNLLSFDEEVFRNFLAYIAAHPDKKDLAFLESLNTFGYPQTDYEKRKLQEYIETAKKNVR